MATKSSTASKKSGATANPKKKAAPKNLHVMPHIDGGWVIRSKESTRARSLHDTKREDIEAGRALAKRAAITLIIHGRDGRVVERNSFKPHPLPPPEPRKVLYPTTLPRNASKDAIKKAVSETISESFGQPPRDQKRSNVAHGGEPNRPSRAMSKRDLRH